jgi:membrane protein DedA with SNARE-associated domain
MSVGRFILAAIAGALLCYWALFLFVAGGMAGEIYWTGNNHGTFVPGYLVSLYAPPVIAGVLGYFALRRRKNTSDAQD